MTTPLALIILAAGQGTRMRSGLAKVLHPLAGLAMVSHVRQAGEALRPARVVGVIAPGAEAVAAALAPHPCVVQAQRLGTADAVLAAKPALAGFDGRVLVVYGDTPLLRAETLQALAAAPAPVSLLCFEPEDPAQYGRVFLNESGQVTRIVEYADAGPAERANRLCNAGVMAFDSAVLWELLALIKPNNAKQEFYLTDAVGLATQRGLACHQVLASAGEVLGVNSRVELAQAEQLLQQRLRHAVMEQGVTLRDPQSVYFCTDTRIAADVVIHPNVVFGPGVSVASGAEILPFSHLAGVSVGENAIIGPYARLRPGSVIGAGAHIGNFVEVKQTEVAAGAKINHLSYIGDASVGKGSNIGAGTITCNYDGFAKHRTTIGADVFVGSNTILVAPVSLGDGAMTAAGSVITQDVAADSFAIARAMQTSKTGWAKRYREKKRGGAEYQRTFRG